MGHHTYKNRCGEPYDPDLVQDVEDLVQSVKDDMVMQELESMEIIRDVQDGRLVPRIGLQRQRNTSEDVTMEDVDAESEVGSNRGNLVGAQHEAEDTRDGEPGTTIMTQPQQFVRDRPHPSEETRSGSKRSRGPRASTWVECDSKENPVEQAKQLRPLSNNVAMEETPIKRDPMLGGHDVLKFQPKTRPFAQKMQWIPEDDIMEDCED